MADPAIGGDLTDAAFRTAEHLTQPGDERVR